jgi:hypothetical protein
VKGTDDFDQQKKVKKKFKHDQRQEKKTATRPTTPTNRAREAPKLYWKHNERLDDLPKGLSDYWSGHKELGVDKGHRRDEDDNDINNNSVV